MMMSAADYRESLRAYRPTVYVDGRRVESVADEPALAPGVNAIALTYDFALRAEYAPIMTAVDAAIPSTDMPGDAGVDVRACPGRSGATSVKRSARMAASRSNECAEAPVPCSSSIVGPRPAIDTCQRRPPAATGARHATVITKDRRTAFEFAVTRGALAQDKPVLGICGGQQLLHVVLGGSLQH